MLEQRLLAACIDSREYYDRLSKFVIDSDFEDYGKHIYAAIDNYYKIDKSAQSINVDWLRDKLAKDFPKKVEAFTVYISELPSNISGLNVIKELNDLRREQLGDEIAAKLIQRKSAIKEMETYLTETDMVTPVVGEVYEAPSLSELSESVKPENLIPIYPTNLNRLIGGGVPRQSQICIFARPDVGKTTTAINIVGGVLNAGYKVLYVGNEDPSEIVIIRVLSRLCNVGKAELIKDADKYDSIARTKGYDNFTFAGLSPGTVPEIRSLVEAIEPDVLVIDQVKNLHVAKASSVENLEEAVEHTRNIAKEFNLVSIVVTQAGESARNKLVLDLEDVYNSKTGIPGQMDLMIGVGQNESYKNMNRVVLSTPKNKLSAPIAPITCRIDYVTNTLYGPKK